MGNNTDSPFWVYLGVKTCEDFLCFVTIIFVLSIVLTSLFSLFYVTREGDRFLHRQDEPPFLELYEQFQVNLCI